MDNIVIGAGTLKKLAVEITCDWINFVGKVDHRKAGQLRNRNTFAAGIRVARMENGDHRAFHDCFALKTDKEIFINMGHNR